jgi:hypothetical protein
VTETEIRSPSLHSSRIAAAEFLELLEVKHFVFGILFESTIQSVARITDGHVAHQRICQEVHGGR